MALTKRLLSKKPLAITLTLALLALIFSIFTHTWTKVSNIPGTDIVWSHYFSTIMLVPLFLGAIFIVIALRIKKITQRSVPGLYVIALGIALLTPIIWLSQKYALAGTMLPPVDYVLFHFFKSMTPLGILIVVYWALLLIGSIMTGYRLRKVIDMQNDYLGMLLATTAFLIFVNDWVAGFFIFTWMFYELRHQETMTSHS